MIVYALIDPRNGKTRYIGKTVRTPHRRLRRHLARYYLEEADTHKNRWLRQLLALGLEPEIVVLEQCSSEGELSIAERRQIADHLVQGASLTNETPGGEGGDWKYTAEARERISKALTGKPRSASHRQHLSDALRGRITSDATRAKQRLAQSTRPRKPWTEAQRITISRANGGFPFVDQYGNRYETQKGAARLLGLNLGHLNEVLHGKRGSVKGYIFTFVNVQEFPEIPTSMEET